MTQHPQVAALTATAVPLPTREEVWKATRAICRERRKDMFTIPQRLENLLPADLATIKVAGTVYEPLEQAAADLGLPTDGTLGALMQPPLSLTEIEAHVFCGCNLGDEQIDGWALELIYHGMSLRHP
jgi:hypothetical protein